MRRTENSFPLHLLLKIPRMVKGLTSIKLDIPSFWVPLTRSNSDRAVDNEKTEALFLVLLREASTIKNCFAKELQCVSLSSSGYGRTGLVTKTKVTKIASPDTKRKPSST